MTKLVILGRKSQTGNYETFFSKLPARAVTTLVPGEVTSCDALILPGGGDITPAFFGEKNKGFVLSEIKRELEEKAEDNRAIEEITDIEGKTKGDKMTISLTIVMTDKTEVEVEVGV